MNNQGNIGDALQELGSSGNIKSLVASIITAGVSAGLTDAVGLAGFDPSQASTIEVFKHKLQTNLIRASVGAAVSSTVQGADFGDALWAATRSALGSAVSETLAGEIGIAYRNAAKDGKSPLEYVTHKIAHAAVGCAGAAIASGDCASGATGAAVGEIVGEAYFSTRRQEALAADLADTLQNGDLTEAEIQGKIDNWRAQGVNLSTLAGGLAAAAAGGDANVGADAAGTAVDSNICGTGACIAIVTAIIAGIGVGLDVADKVIVAVDAVNLAEQVAACNGGQNPAACNAATEQAIEFGIVSGVEFGTVVVPGSAIMAKITLGLRKRVDPKDLDKVDDALRGGDGKTYQTYTKTNEKTGEVYSGRTSGTNDPLTNVENRDRNHHKNTEGFGPADLDKSSPNKDAIRGREQQLIDQRGGAKSQGGTSGNAIQGIADKNPKKQRYLDAAKEEFGDD